MVRDVLKILAYFNWITPLEIVTRRAFYGPSYSFKIPETSGWSGAGIVNMLRQQGGISTYGYMFVNDHFMFHVPREQARFAQYLMQRAGIPIMNPVQSTERNHPYQSPHSEEKGKDFLDEIDGFIEAIRRDIGFS